MRAKKQNCLINHLTFRHPLGIQAPEVSTQYAPGNSTEAPRHLWGNMLTPRMPQVLNREQIIIVRLV
jgi:hypothetical protein